MTPFVGEGVNTAIRDAVELANALHPRIQNYEREMFKGVEPVTRKTEDMMKLMLFTEGDDGEMVCQSYERRAEFVRVDSVSNVCLH